MIVFHEGLPGSGKSYEACVEHILPAIKSGRQVITNIEGINHAKFAELSGIPQRFVDQMLICCDHADEPDIERRVALQKESMRDAVVNDALVVFDEIQDLFPSGRQKLDVDWQKFFTEHRHLGLDIICMGQDRRDCHAIIRRRIQRCISYTKQIALGRPNKYLWVAYEATTPEKYKQISSGSKSYEKKYFGCYASHTAGTGNKSTYTDDRTNVFKTPLFKWVLPATAVLGFFCIRYLVGMFTPDEVQAATVTEPPPAEVRSMRLDPAHGVPAQGVTQTPPPSLPPAPTQPAEPPPPLDVFDKDASKYRPRLAGVVTYGEDGSKIKALVEMMDSSFHVHDAYSVEALVALGWSVTLNAAGLIVSKEKKQYVIRPWPVDPFGRASDHTRGQL